MFRVLIVPSGGLIVFASVMFPTAVHASGFRILEQSAEQVANANAGAGSQSDSAVVVISNPAGSADMEDTGLSVSAMTIFGNTSFEDSGSASPLFGPYTGTQSVDLDRIAVLPTFAFYTKISDQITVNLAGFAPYGNARDYDSEWVGRYQLSQAKALSFELNPSIAFQLSDDLAIGVGVGVQYLRAEISNDIDFGGLCSIAVDPMLCADAGILPQGADGAAFVDVDDVSVGFNLGLLYRPSDRTRIGLTYRSSIEHTLRGTVAFEKPTLPAPFDAFTNQPFTLDDDVSGQLKMPQMVNLSVSHDLSKKLTVLADVGWQDWSVLDKFALKRSNGAPDLVSSFGFQDHVTTALALNFQADDRLKLRAGASFSFDLKKARETVSFPANESFKIGLGAGYALSEKFAIDLAYSYVNNGDVSSRSVSDLDSGIVIGDFKLISHVVAIQFNKFF